MKIGSRVSVEDVNSIFYFSHMGFAARARLFWRRAGYRGEKVAAIGKSFVKGFWKGTSREEVRPLSKTRPRGTEAAPRKTRPGRRWPASASSTSRACWPARSAPCPSATWAPR